MVHFSSLFIIIPVLGPVLEDKILSYFIISLLPYFGIVLYLIIKIIRLNEMNSNNLIEDPILIIYILLFLLFHILQHNNIDILCFIFF